MKDLSKVSFIIMLHLMAVCQQLHGQGVTLQGLIEGMSSNNDMVKYYASLVQSRQAAVTSAKYERLPHINTLYQATLSSANNVQGGYLAMGVIPSVSGGRRSYNNFDPQSGNTALAGIDWEVTNFGGFQARTDLAKSNLSVQNNMLAKGTYDLQGIAAAYYVELMRQYELQQIDRDNVDRLQQLLTSINSLVVNGIRPGVDSAIASAEISKSRVALYEAQKNFDQLQVQLSTLTGLPIARLQPDTTAGDRLLQAAPSFILSAAVDTQHHPDLQYYSALTDLSRSRLNLERRRYYPKLMLDADVWTRASSLSNTDVYNKDLAQGYIPQRMNYFVGLTLAYDLMNIARKHINASIYKYEAEAAQHRLDQERLDLTTDLQKARIESDYQLRRLSETERQMRAADIAFGQQSNLYRNGLSSVIDLNLALSYSIQARKDYLDSKAGYMRSVLNYALVTNSFTNLVQTLKL
ncbi:MAG: TolC family protein [Bacteroidetes bacterium]|nr:TolC family protein [Bacteroidota bacterium]